MRPRATNAQLEKRQALIQAATSPKFIVKRGSSKDSSLPAHYTITNSPQPFRSPRGGDPRAWHHWHSNRHMAFCPAHPTAYKLPRKHSARPSQGAMRGTLITFDGRWEASRDCNIQRRECIQFKKKRPSGNLRRIAEVHGGPSLLKAGALQQLPKRHLQERRVHALAA